MAILDYKITNYEQIERNLIGTNPSVEEISA
jgi:hypothetical protein